MRQVCFFWDFNIDYYKYLKNISYLSLELDSDRWDNWEKNAFANTVEEKIEEYRKKVKESLEQPELPEEPNYFNDMEPKLKQTRKVSKCDANCFFKFYQNMKVNYV